jgi:hypothetical protein
MLWHLQLRMADLMPRPVELSGALHLCTALWPSSVAAAAALAVVAMVVSSDPGSAVCGHTEQPYYHFNGYIGRLHRISERTIDASRNILPDDSPRLSLSNRIAESRTGG